MIFIFMIDMTDILIHIMKMQYTLRIDKKFFELMFHVVLSHQHFFLINTASFLIEHFNEDFCTSKNVQKSFSIYP